MSRSGDSHRWFSQSRGAILVLVVACVAWGLIFWRQLKYSPQQEHISSGMQLLNSGNMEAAEQQWLEAVQLDPKNAEAWSLLGDLYVQSHDYKAAYDAYKHVLQIDPDSANLQEQLAICAYGVQDNAAAERYAEQALKQNSNNISALQILVQVENQSGQSADRLAHLKQLVELQPQSISALSDLVDELGKRREYDKALPYIDQLVKLDPNSATPYYRRAVALYITNPDAQAMTRAQADLHTVLELDPDNVEAHRYLGRIALRLNKPLDAIKEFEEVGRGRPYASAHLAELSNAYRQAGNIQKAEQLRMLFGRISQFNARAMEAQEALNAAPQEADKQLQLGLLLLRGMESDEAYFQWYRYRYLQHQIQGIDFYFESAHKSEPQNPAIQSAFKELESAYTHRLSAGVQALQRHDDSTAAKEIAHVLLMRPNDKRTQDALSQCVVRGINPLGELGPNIRTSDNFGN